jgi:hypothetical protein
MSAPAAAGGSSQENIVCEVCTSAVHDEKYVGCCNDGDCPKKIERMCDSCGTWDAAKEVWRCPPCAAAAPKDVPIIAFRRPFDLCWWPEGFVAFEPSNPWADKPTVTVTKPFDVELVYTYKDDSQDVVFVNSTLPHGGIPTSLLFMACPKLADMKVVSMCVYPKESEVDEFTKLINDDSALKWLPMSNGKYFFNPEVNNCSEVRWLDERRRAFIEYVAAFPTPNPVKVAKVMPAAQWWDARLGGKKLPGTKCECCDGDIHEPPRVRAPQEAAGGADHGSVCSTCDRDDELRFQEPEGRPPFPASYQGPQDRRVKVFKTWAAANPAEAAAFNTAMSTWRAQRDEAWTKYAGLM